MIHKLRSTFGDAVFYTALVVCLTAAAIGGYALLRPAPQLPAVSAALPQSEQPAATAVLPTPIPEAEPTPAETPEEPEPQAQAPEVPASAPIQAAEPIQPVKPQPSTLVVSPLSGQVVAAFSSDRLSYNTTLGDWRTHDGMDIGAAAGTNVLAASAGTVLQVTEDDLLGTTVVLEHSRGYQTTYANLQAQPTVAEGDTVTAGQIIGAVGTTAMIERAAGPHLHFSVCKDGDLIDPQEYLKDA